MNNFKTATISALLFVLSSQVSANESATTANQNAYNQLCEAALTSESAFKSKSRELGIGKKQRERLVCNEMTVETFAKNYELTEQNTIATVQ